MKPLATDNNPLPHRYRHLLPLSGLTRVPIQTVCTIAQQWSPPSRGRSWSLPLPAPVLLALIHSRTNLTTPAPADGLRPTPANNAHPPIIDATPIPAHDQAITAISKNYRRSVNAEVVLCADRRRVVAVGRSWPGNRNHVIVARATVPHLLTGEHVILGDGGYRGIPAITAPAQDRSGRIIRDDNYRAHRRIRARLEHVPARLKDWQILRQCRRPGQAINHILTNHRRTLEPQNPQPITGQPLAQCR